MPFSVTKRQEMVLFISILIALIPLSPPDTVVAGQDLGARTGTPLATTTGPRTDPQTSERTKPIRDYLPADLFIPPVRLIGLNPWTSAPLPRPVVEVIRTDGFEGSVGFGEYSIQHR